MVMDGKTSPGRPAVSGYARLAASPATPGSDSRSCVSTADLARVAPFAAPWPYLSFLELGALPGAVPCARLHTRQMLWEWDLAQFVILVWDASPLPPVPVDAGGDAENGRGLLLVQAISARWGWHFPQDIGGKVVWAQLQE